jgi:hypothetical protein
MVSSQWTYELTKHTFVGIRKSTSNPYLEKDIPHTNFHENWQMIQFPKHIIGLTFFDCTVNTDTYLTILNAFVNQLTDEDPITVCFHSKMGKIKLRLSGL